MATKYPKKHSPYWYIEFIDKDGVRRNQSSGLRCDSPKDTAEADILVAKLTKAEVSRGLHGGVVEPRWEFVPKFLKDHCRTEGTYQRYKNRWEWISLFLAEKKLRVPENIVFAHGQAYVDWRTSFKKRVERPFAGIRPSWK